ncbi:MAG TPA: nitroreductase family protein [Anaerolineae bacterium]
MDVFEAVKTMLAVRSYRDESIPDEMVTRILEAGRLSASSQNKQHWDFIAVREPATLRRLGELARTGGYIAGASLAIAVVVPDRPVGYIDGARATQDMMLVAWEAGIGSNWVGNVNTDAIKELLNIPADRMVLTVIPFGYPVEELGEGIKDRKPLSEVAHAERFGQPYR